MIYQTVTNWWKRYDILTCEDIDYFTAIKFVSKLYLNSLVYHRNIFRSSSKVFGNLWKFSENVRERSSGLWNNFGKSSEIFRKWSEIFGESSKKPSSLTFIIKIKRTLHVSSKIWILCSRGKNNILLSRSLRLLMRYCSCHSNVKFISSRHRVIFSMYTIHDLYNV